MRLPKNDQRGSRGNGVWTRADAASAWRTRVLAAAMASMALVAANVDISRAKERSAARAAWRYLACSASAYRQAEWHGAGGCQRAAWRRRAAGGRLKAAARQAYGGRRRVKISHIASLHRVITAAAAWYGDQNNIYISRGVRGNNSMACGNIAASRGGISTDGSMAKRESSKRRNNENMRHRGRRGYGIEQHGGGGVSAKINKWRRIGVMWAA